MDQQFEDANEIDNNVSNDVSHETIDEAPSDADSPNSEQPTAFDLSTVERVKLGERELTREELEKSFMLHSDYTRKTQSLSQEKRYIDNLEKDLERVAANPKLINEFKRIYPEKYHNYLRFISNGQTNGNQAQNGQGATNKSVNGNNGQANGKPEVPEYVSTLEKRLMAIEAKEEAQELKHREAELETVFTKFTGKYPLAVPNGEESFVLSAAQKVLQANGQLNEHVWEKIFKAAHKHHETAYTNYHKQRIELAKKTNARGKDMASGGGTLGASPNRPKTIKDATKAFLEDFGSGRISQRSR